MFWTLQKATFLYRTGKILEASGEKEQLSSEVLSDDFDLEEAVDSLSIQKMDAKEKELFDQIVQEQVNIQGLEGEDAENLKNAVTSYFDSSSENKNKLFNTQADYYNDAQNIVKPQLIAIDVNFGGTVLNVALGAAVGGGVGAIQAFIAKREKKRLRESLPKL